jgi:hypothetical protein
MNSALLETLVRKRLSKEASQNHIRWFCKNLIGIRKKKSFN